jgi:FkbM family methyltransferase
MDEAELRHKYWDPKFGDVVFDVGASYGAYALTAFSVGAIVFAFEPEHVTFEDLCDSVHATKLFDMGMHVFPFGLSDKDEAIDARALMPHWPAQTITHPYVMHRLDDIARGRRRLDWLKIDVEGMEEKVLRGGQETIKRCRPRVLCECHVFMDKDMVEKCKSLLTGYTFEVVPMRGGDETVMLVGTP